MRVMSGLQVIRLANGNFQLVFKTRTNRYLDILGEVPYDFTQAVWDRVKTQALKSVKDWITSFDDRSGLIVYEGQCYEFSVSDRTSLMDWPLEVRSAFYWLKRNFSITEASVIH